MSASRRVVALNRALADRIARRWPYRGARAFDEFPGVIRRYFDQRPNDTVVDVGAGADSSFLQEVRGPERAGHVIGLDIDSSYMTGNDALDERRELDAAGDRLPFDDGTVGLITSRSVLEHLHDVERFAAESARVLAPGGYSVHICSCRNAPFAVAGRILPPRLSRRLLFWLHPEAVGVQGFETYYDHCTPSGLARVFRRHGFDVIEERVSYRSSQYFTSLGPLFLLARAYESLLARLGARRLASYVTIVGRKPTSVTASVSDARTRTKVVYWNYMPAPYMVDRFDALAARDNLDFEVWLNTRREPHWSGAWTVDESRWLFDYRYIPHFFVRGRSVGFPPDLLGSAPPDVLVSPHGEPSFVAGWTVARARGVRTAFWVVKTFDSWAPRQTYKETLKRYMFPRTDAIFVPGDDAREYARSYGAPDERIITLPHPVNAEFVEATKWVEEGDRDRIRRELGLTGTTFLYVGRLWWGKGLKHLIDAFTGVQRSGHDVSLMLVGDGDQRDELEAAVRDAGLRNVAFVGFKQKSELPSFYSACDVFVFPTLGDPFGLVVGEAMSCGLPIISTSAAGEIRSRVEDGHNGFIVPPADSVVLADRMTTLATDPALLAKMGPASKAKITGFTPERWGRDFEEGIAQLLALPPIR